MELNVSAIFPSRPVHDPGSLTEKSPSRMVRRPAKITLRSGEAESPTSTECPFFFSPGSGLPLATTVAASGLLLFMFVVSWKEKRWDQFAKGEGTCRLFHSACDGLTRYRTHR